MLAVVKIGGSLVYHEEGRALRRLGVEIALLSAAHPLAIVPGGGPFAGVVREYGYKLGLGDSTCHLMALAAMDQYGYLLKEFIPGSRLMEMDAVCGTRRAGTSPSYPLILLCSRWIGRVPPAELPPSWEVTSDSIAAYIAGRLGAPLLVLLKSTDAGAGIKPPLVDPFFNRVVPPSLRVYAVNGLYPGRLTGILEKAASEGRD